MDRAGRGHGTRGGVLPRLANGRGVPTGRTPSSTAGGALPAVVAVCRRVRVEMRSEDGFAVGGAGEPGETEADADGPVVSTESVPCVELLEKGVGWATVVAAAGASTEPVPTSVGAAKTEARGQLQAKTARGRDSDQRRRRRQKHDRRDSSKEQKGRQFSYVARVCENRKWSEVKGSPPKTVLSVRGTSSPGPFSFCLDGVLYSG